MRRHITPKLSLSEYAKDFASYFELLFFLTKRDFSVRYKQTLVGGLWAVIVPIISVLVLSFVFGGVAKLEPDGTNYQLMVYSGMLAWGIFVVAMQNGALNLVNNAGLVTKVYFPRIILPLSALGVAVVDFVINLAVFVVLGLFLGLFPSWRILTIPLWLLLVIWVSVGPMFMMASWLVRYRDLRFLVPFMIQFGLFITPIGFSVNAIPADMYPYFCVNPLVGVIEGFRWALLGLDTFPTFSLLCTLGVSTFLMFSGIYLFIKAERTMADIL